MKNTKGDGGMAIAIKENIPQFVTKVAHVTERVMIMHIESQIRGKATIAINTHAPDMSNDIDIRAKYWNRINHVLYREIRKDFLIWATGDNGQFSRNPDTDGEIIGK